MANRIPREPLDAEPFDLYEPNTGQDLRRTGREALAQALTEAGVELGAYDERIVKWLGEFDLSAATTIASWILRAHATGRDTI
jgi:hypothetical protein